MDLSRFLPSLKSFSPTLSHTDVPVLPEIVARFSTEIDTSQVLLDNDLNSVVLLISEDTARAYPVSFISYSDKTLKFAPQSNLVSGETYIVTILGSLRSPEGREMGVNRSWPFTVGDTEVPTVSLVAPADLTAYSDVPTLEWEAATVSTGTVNYLVELDETPQFLDPLWDTTTSQTYADIGIALPTKRTYWWRVATSVTIGSEDPVYGPPSDIWAFYLGSSISASPETQATSVSISTTTLQLVDSGFEDGDTNLLSWPDLTLTFSEEISSGSITSGSIYLRRESVDGWPTSDYFRVPADIVLDGDTITLTPSEVIRNNTRYTLVVKNLKDINDNSISFEMYFTGRYKPLYTSVMVLRADFGELLANVSDDFINFHIYKASLDVNRYYIRWYHSTVWVNGPTEEAVRNFTFIPTYDMQRWVEIEAIIRILGGILGTKITTSGKKRRLADFDIEESASSSIAGLLDLLSRLRKEADLWLIKFNRMATRPRSARKSEQWPRENMRNDMSWRDKGRTEL
jgi:hypothetical protein